MIIYIINGYFFDDAGFSKRCQREVAILSQHEKIIVICRDKKNTYKNLLNKNVKIASFFLRESLVENPKNYKSGIYEIYRNVALFLPLMKSVLSNLYENRRENITVYVVASPMTVPFFCMFLILFFKISNSVLEFHDLEPEMAMTIKNIKKTNFITQIEYLLEKILCKYYSKIIVTNNTQKKIISHRTMVNDDKIFTLYNSINVTDENNIKLQNATFPFSAKDFVIGYISSMTFEYTVSAICNLISEMSEEFHKHPELKFLIIGDGDMLYKIKNVIDEYHLEKQIVLTGKITSPEEILKKLDVGIIPLPNDDHTNSVIPTRLFEYLATKIPVIVPDFQSFKEIIIHSKNGLLYSSINDLKHKILYLKNNPKEKKLLAESGYSQFVHQYAFQNYAKQYLEFLYN